MIKEIIAIIAVVLMFIEMGIQSDFKNATEEEKHEYGLDYGRNK